MDCFNKYKEGLEKYNSSKLVIFDLDYTIGEQKNANIYIKEIIKNENDLKSILNDNIKNQYFKMVNNIKKENLKYYDQAVLIKKIDDYNDMKENLPVNKNEYYIMKLEYNKDNLFNLKDIIKENNYNYQITLKNDKNKEYCSLEELESKKLNNNDKIVLELYSKNKEKLNKIHFLYTYYLTPVFYHIKKMNIKEIDISNLNEDWKIKGEKYISEKEIQNIIKNNINIFENVDTIERLKSFDSITYNKYKKKKNDLIPNYSDFRNGEKFINNLIIYPKIKNKLIEHYNKGNLTIILTAREKFNIENNNKLAKEKIISFFNKNNIPLGNIKNKKIHLFFSGRFSINKNLNINETNEIVLKKLSFIDYIINNKNIKKIIMYEDNENMLKTLKKFINKNYKNIEYEGYLIKNKKINKYFDLKKEIIQNQTI